MSEFKWHLMADECPPTGYGHYIIMGHRGGMYIADNFETAPYSDYRCFHVPNVRGNYKYDHEVKAWAEIPPLEVHRACHDVSDVDGIFICSECKCQIEGMVVLNGANRWVVPPYCPNCGREVES